MLRALVTLLLALLLAGCASEPEGAQPPAANSTEDDDADAPMRIAAVPLSISLVERATPGVPPTTMALEPARLEVREDQRVNLTITNEGRAPHDLVIEALGVDTGTIAPGESVTVEFVAQERGEYVMHCSVGGDGPTGHRSQGMHGSFVVA